MAFNSFVQPTAMVMETRNLEMVAHEMLTMDEKPEGIKVPGGVKASDAAGGMNLSRGFVPEEIPAEGMILASGKTLQIKAGDIQNLM